MRRGWLLATMALATCADATASPDAIAEPDQATGYALRATAGEGAVSDPMPDARGPRPSSIRLVFAGDIAPALLVDKNLRRRAILPAGYPFQDVRARCERVRIRHGPLPFDVELPHAAAASSRVAAVTVVSERRMSQYLGTSAKKGKGAKQRGRPAGRPLAGNSKRCGD